SDLNASSGPYADDDRPSAPSPTHAKNATSETRWKIDGSRKSFLRPNNRSLSRCTRRVSKTTASRFHQGRIKAPLKLDLQPELDDAVRRQVEERRRRPRVAREEREQHLAPLRDARLAGGEQRLAPEVVRGVGLVDDQVVSRAAREDLRHVRLLHE